MDLSSLWETVLRGMEGRIGHQDVEIWLRGGSLRDFDGRTLEVEVANQYYADWISENYSEALTEEARSTLGPHVTVHVGYAEEDTTEVVPRPAVAPESIPRADGLNGAQTFQSFVVGECNKFAHAAASAVADYPAQNYNPLFIYGSTGLGKTHLMHAIGNEILRRHSNARVVYVTAEAFMTEMIDGIQHNRMEDFRSKYRKRATVLLVDDIQFLSGKDRTQEEFFHTFNVLQSSGRQIVLTSDVTPKHIEKLEPRLRTRFEGGLLADMQAPDMETLLAILRQKAAQQRIEVPGDLANAIAHKVAGNIRELEGIINRLAALQTFYNEPLTLDFARDKLPNVFAATASEISCASIIEAVARLHTLRAADIIGGKRTRTLTRPRHIAMYLARKHTRLSFPELGREFGDRDHSTIQHGCRKITEELEVDPDLAYKIRLIEQGLHLQ